MTERSSRAVFVTGGTGFVGSHLVECLQEKGYGDIRCLVRSSPRWLEGLDVRKVFGRLNNAALLEDALAGVAYVYHVGGLTRARTAVELVEANVDSTVSLLRAVRRFAGDARKVIVTSSLAVVGRAEPDIATENTPLRPITAYGRSKAEMERRVWGTDRDGVDFSDALPIVMVRPPAVYGPREKDILSFFRAASRGLCPIVGDRHRPAVSLVYVEDLVNGMIQAAESDVSGETYFLGGPRQYSWNDVREATEEALGRRLLAIPIPPAFVGAAGFVSEVAGKFAGRYPALNREKAREIRYACKMCSSEKAKLELQYRPAVDLDNGIRRTINWYRDEGWI